VSRGPLSRRELLAVVSAGSIVGACRSEPKGPPGIPIPLAEIPEGKRVVVERGDEPIELLRTGDEVRARSLWCTHYGCRVKWVEEHGFYACPCHGGIFAADGRVLEGPPPAPLRELPVTRDGDNILLPFREEAPAARPEPPRRSSPTA